MFQEDRRTKRTAAGQTTNSGENAAQDRGHFQTGIRLLQAGDCSNAIECFSMAAALNPTFGEAYGYRGFAYYVLGTYAEAMDDYNRALDLDSSLEKVYFFRGLLRSRLFLYREAIEDFSIAIEWDGDLDRAYCYRGLCRGALEDHSGALHDLVHAAQLGNTKARSILNARGVAW